MSNVRIEIVKAATLSMAATMSIPLSTADLSLYGNAVVVPLHHGTALQSAAVQQGEFLSVTPLTSLAVPLPRAVTAAEDRWLRKAVVRASTLVARGKLVTPNA
jgi:hypothetical protein